ncbi:MAG: polysaccharide export protein [Lachnospiraceae bacterium]|nr:polysaccharide export protein [Lachnospiraceae bacterium]
MDDKNLQNDEVEIDLREIFFLLFSKKWIILLAAIIGAGILGGYTMLFISPTYTSTSQIYVLSRSTSITSLTDLQMGTQLTQDYVEFIQSRPVVDRVIEELNLDMTYNELVKNITVTNKSNTRIIYITVSSHDAYMSKTIVDKLTDVSIARMGEIMETDAPNVMDYGHIAEHKSAPNTKKNALIGAAAGVVIACGIIIVLFLMNDSIKTSEDVEKYLGLNTLGMIPMDGNVSKKKTRGHDVDAMRSDKKKKKSLKDTSKNGK